MSLALEQFGGRVAWHCVASSPHRRAQRDQRGCVLALVENDEVGRGEQDA
jgi:hypothetical protein